MGKGALLLLWGLDLKSLMWGGRVEGVGVGEGVCKSARGECLEKNGSINIHICLCRMDSPRE